MQQFPKELITPMIGAAITMLIAVWLIFASSAKRLTLSFVIGVALSAWFTVALFLSYNGFFLTLSLWPIPNIGLMFVPIIIGITLLAKSATFRTIVDTISQPWLIGAQTTRIMGAAFLTLYARGLMPAQFAIPSGIGDVMVGITAPLVALILFFNQTFGRALAITWNIIGFLELTLAIVLGFFTSPTPYQLLALSNPNNFLFDFPLALIPTFAVPLSLLLHIFSLRVLYKRV